MSSRRLKRSVALTSVSVSAFRSTVTFRNFPDTAQNIDRRMAVAVADLGLGVATTASTARQVVVTLDGPFHVHAMARAVRDHFALHDYEVVHVPGTAVLTFQDRSTARRLVLSPPGFGRARSPARRRSR